ncbi:phosphoglycerol transferase I [Franconibacter daqui]|uniref:phosphoglycerol transferase I n=1 Tax=Franconibacter daqui TaxID=2047724 RepID=UPI0030CC0DF9
MTYFLITLLTILTLASSRWIITKSIVTALVLLLFAFWYICDMFTGNGITDAVYYHLFNTARGTSLEDITSKVYAGLLFIFAMIIIMASSFILKARRKNIIQGNGVNIIYVIVLIAIAFNPFAVNIYHSFKDNYINRGSSFAVKDNYHKIKGELPKKYNYVFIYAESLERTFRMLGGKDYLPGINKIANQHLEFTNIEQPLNMGMGWTMAGMVNTQCGIPLVMAQGNSGSNVSHFLSGADCVATWLTRQGYQTEFIRGSQKEFAGGDKFLAQHGWQTQHDKPYFVKNGLATPEQISGWGVHDDALLAHSWQEFVRLSQSDKPFLLSFLTVNTHPPVGTFLPQCDNHVDKNSQYQMLSSVSCSDYLLTDFINKIKNSPWFDNTIIVLVSDHIMMANDANPLLSKQEAERRNNFIVIKKDLVGIKNNTPGTLLDVWPTVLDLSGASVKAFGFGKSLLDNKAGPFINDYNSGKARDYLAYASQLWNYPSLNDQMVQQGEGIQIGSQHFSLPLYSIVNKNGRFDSLWFEAFAKNITRILKPKDTFFYANQCKKISINEDGICAYIVSPGMVKQMRITSQGIVAQKTISKSSSLYSGNLLGISAGPLNIESGGTLAEKEMSFPSGISFFAANSSPNEVHSYFTCGGGSLPQEELNAYLHQKAEPVIFTSNDSVVCQDRKPLEQLAKLLNVNDVLSLQIRQQIIGIYTPSNTQYVAGIPEQPLDAFVDTKAQHLIKLCSAFFDCR